jgi:sterol desaturase/sphingolipid hydroxylase (fatty acid hydroxylase superfamily)
MTDVMLANTSVEPERRATPWAVTWLTWPLLFATTIGVIFHALRFRWDLGTSLGVLTLGAIAVLVTLEFLYPLERRWRMTWRTFFGRDIWYFAAAGGTIAAANVGFALLGMELGKGHAGPLTHWPVWLAAPALILAFEFFQYWQHRFSHEANTPFKQFLWRAHAAHHLPEQVYVLMHPVNHPFNAFWLQGLIRIPLFYVLGASPEALFAATAITGLQGIISHCNVELRAGLFNYLFVGTELHRFHHSADPVEGQNYGVVTPIFDLMFGTFSYAPARLPARLGVTEPAAYPRATEFFRVMRLPLRTKP